ncbi:Tetratricopeptide repeat protein 28 [Anabarilius grahami]|uniref:Tetratricopeptide repeat protein 28 n=1 Tax=Anabarilius grahami TaxID=495550 RepID=A0A3N0YIU4_ANAGA|nr:Tetratricopeptide repeat protein 28 [Anabarilius grahami]
MEKVRQSNEACQLGDFQTAVKLYGEALRADPQNCILYSNRSAAHLKLGQYQTALDDAVKARLLNPKWPKTPLNPFREATVSDECEEKANERRQVSLHQHSPARTRGR